MGEVKDELHAELREARAALVAALEGLSEYDVRRPMTASGTNLLGLGERRHVDTPGLVAHWGEGHGATTLGYLLIRMVEETGHHAGHAEILRELILGRPGQADAEQIGDSAHWSAYVATIQKAADGFRESSS